MSQRKILVGIIGIGVLCGIFFVREFFQLPSSLRIFGEENFAVVQSPSGEIIYFGDTETSRKNVLLRAIQPYFSRKNPIMIVHQVIGTSVEGPDFALTRITENIARASFNNSTIWFYGAPTEDELTVLKSTPIPLESDFWILEKNNYPDFFPIPTQAILHMNERKPSEKLENFARKKKIPLVAIRETGGFRLELQDSGWKMQIR